MRLVTDGALAAKEGNFDARRGQVPERYNLTPLDQPLAGRALKFYLLLTHMPELIADQGLSAEQLFWSRYYWFLRYVKVQAATEGRNVGLEQQAFQILESPEPSCSPDWSVLAEIEETAERDVAAQLRAAAEGPQ